MIEILKAIIIGIIQGITEVLPISSSAHNAVIHYVLFKNSISLTSEIFLHISSTLACVIFLRKDILNLIKQLFNKDYSYLIKLIIGTLPAFIIYLVFGKYIKSIFDSLFLIGIFLIFTSFILMISSTLFNKLLKNNITYKNSFYIGLCQSLALIPGISRSGFTLFGGLSNKICLKETVKYSFFLYLISSIGSCILDFNNLINITINTQLIITFLVTFIFTYISLIFLYNKLSKKHFVFFSFYTFILGIILIIINL